MTNWRTCFISIPIIDMECEGHYHDTQWARTNLKRGSNFIYYIELQSLKETRSLRRCWYLWQMHMWETITNMNQMTDFTLQSSFRGFTKTLMCELWFVDRHFIESKRMSDCKVDGRSLSKRTTLKLYYSFRSFSPTTRSLSWEKFYNHQRKDERAIEFCEVWTVKLQWRKEQDICIRNY